MNQQFLDFEQPIAELSAKTDELRRVGTDANLNIQEEIEKLEQKSQQLTKSIFSSLTSWQVVQLARHPMRPYTSDYIKGLFTEFDELKGDRHFGEGSALIAGIARFEGQPVMVIGHEKGRKTKEKIHRNFGMCRPECYRRALRLMKLAERFSLPIFTFIDTAGAYPGIGAEERNQSESIARNLFEMAKLRTPVICTVIGEGGSGGALAIGVGDHVAMLEYSVYSVISPEGCASILWKSAEKKDVAAEALGLTATRIHRLGLVDHVIKEPLGGAHRDPNAMITVLRDHLRDQLSQLQQLPMDRLLAQRYQRLMNVGKTA